MPPAVENFSVFRDSVDACHVKLNWEKAKEAIGYNVRYGIAPNKLYLNYQVYNVDSLNIYSLNGELDYYFTIDAFNENGIAESNKILK